MKKTALLLTFSICAIFHTNAQLTIKSDGRVVVGPDTRPNDDMYHALSMSIRGRNGVNNAGSKLAFGDFGRYDHDGWNVFIGEYGPDDSDILWLHGKKGIKMTSLNGDYLMAEWSYNGSETPLLTLYDHFRADRFSVSSDDNHKSEIRKIKYALPRLMQLNGVIYNYKPIENTCPIGDKEEAKKVGELTEKEKASEHLATSTLKSRGIGDTRYGLMTSEIKKIFPELVECDSLGNQYVNYLELIPIMVSAIGELYTAIEKGGTPPNLLNDYEENIARGTTDSIYGGYMQFIHGTNNNPLAENTTALYQNSPNPFSNTTSIEYRISSDAKNAALYVFDLTGALMQSYPISTFGHGQTIISGSTLNAGMYVYTLVVDEQVVDTKRMVLIK